MSKETHSLTSFNFLAQGFWAFLKPSSASLVSLNPPIICLWYESFCQFFTFSKSSLIRLFFTSWWSSLTFSASVITATQARSTVPYWGPSGGTWVWVRHCIKRKTTQICYWIWLWNTSYLCLPAVSISWTTQSVAASRLSQFWHAPGCSSSSHCRACDHRQSASLYVCSSQPFIKTMYHSKFVWLKKPKPWLVIFTFLLAYELNKLDIVCWSVSIWGAGMQILF